MQKNKIIWKKSGLCDLVEVSNIGQVRLRVDRENGRYKNAVGRHKRGYIFKPSVRHGYKYVRVTINGKRKEYRINRLVCEAFHGAPKEKNLHAAHKDGNSLNNFASNLYWATPQQNIDDREKHKKTMRGEKHYAAILTENDVRNIRKKISNGESLKKIATEYKVSHYTIYDIKRKKSWKHV